MKVLTLSVFFLALITMVQAAELPPDIFNDGDLFLFQGDSITDMGRGHNQDDKNHILGHGYAFIIAAKYGASYPNKQLKFMNRGVSGNTVDDLTERWQADTIAYKPNVLSILIGINDIASQINDNRSVSLNHYEETYDKLIIETLTHSPEIKLVLCEPFILPGKHTSPHWNEYQQAVQHAQAIVAKLGEKYHVPVVYFQKVFDEAAKLKTPADYWIWDGIHPTYAGHQLLADEWVRTYEAFYGRSLTEDGKTKQTEVNSGEN